MSRALFLLTVFIFTHTSIHAEDINAAPSHLQTIFQHLKIKTTLEFGLSGQTSYFLKHSNKVITVDFITHGYGPDSLKATIEQNRAFSNWIPIAFFSGYQGDTNWAPYRYHGSESIYKATSHVNAYNQDYAPIDNFYITEINSFIKNLKKCYQLDIAYIGGAIYLRGDIVQSLFAKVPIIIGEGPSSAYLYCKVSVPEDYQEICTNQGYTIWISKNNSYQELIAKLTN